MSMKRPFFLDLRLIRLPVGGWVSILHRVTGAGLSLVVPGVLYLFMLSLRSPADFALVSRCFDGLFGQLLRLGLIWALLHHLFAGLRHLGFDLGWGEEKARARHSAWAVLGLGVALSLLIVMGGP